LYVQEKEVRLMSASAVKNRRVEVRFSSSDFVALSDFANFQGQSVSELIRTTLMDRVAQWEDVDAAEKALDDIAAGKQKVYSHEDAMARIGLR
jgi:predicted DNA-binding protein